MLLPIHGGLFALVDDEDFERLSKFKWHLSHRKGWVYVVRSNRIGAITYKPYLHREVMGAVKGQQIDHRDRNPFNNQKCNLRFSNQSQNMMNRTRSLKSKNKFRGVSPSHGKWFARVKVRGKTVCSKCFDREEDAAKAYDNMARDLHGDFAVLNFP